MTIGKETSKELDSWNSKRREALPKIFGEAFFFVQANTEAIKLFNESYITTVKLPT